MRTHTLPLVSAALLALVALNCGDSSTGSGGSTASSTTGSAVTAVTVSATTTAGQTTTTSTASSGTGGAPGDPSCATTGKDFLLCDDFETQAVGADPDSTKWTVDKGTGATVLIDDAQKKYGDHALHLHTLGNASKALLHETKTFPLPGGTDSFYGRAYFMTSATTVVPNPHTNFFEASGKVNGNPGGNYRYGSSGGKFLANYNPGDPTKGSATHVPTGSWSCYEWAFLGDTNEMHFYIDGTELTDVAIPSTGVNGTVWKAPVFDSAYFGWITYEAGNASDIVDVWYDNIAIDVTRIGCDK